MDKKPLQSLQCSFAVWKTPNSSRMTKSFQQFFSAKENYAIFAIKNKDEKTQNRSKE